MAENPRIEFRPLLLTYAEAALLLGLRTARGEPNKKAIQLLVRDKKLQVVFLSPQTRRIPYASCEAYTESLISAAGAAVPREDVA